MLITYPVQMFFLNIPLIFLENFSLSFMSFGFNNPIFVEWRNLYPFFLNNFLTVSSQTLLPSPETNRSLLIGNDPNSSLNLHISRKIILSYLSDAFFDLALSHLRLSTTCIESVDFTACRYRLALEYFGWSFNNYLPLIPLPWNRYLNLNDTCGGTFVNVLVIF